MNASKRVVNILESLLEQGRGFDLQSQGTRNDNDYFNFALYSPPGTPLGKQTTIYKHEYTLEELADSMEFIINEFDEQKVEIKSKGLPMPLPRG